MGEIMPLHFEDGPYAECELHGLPNGGQERCTMCYKIDGQCNIGGCNRRAALRLIQRGSGGQVMERRLCCTECKGFALSIGRGRYEVAPL